MREIPLATLIVMVLFYLRPARGTAFAAIPRCSVRHHDRMFKPNLIENFLDGRTLRIGAGWRDFPVAVCVCPRIAHDNLTKSPPPCLRGATFLTNEAGDQEVFEV